MSRERPLRFLFCVPTMQLSGGIKVVLELSDRLARAGHDVDLFSYSGPPTWRSPVARFLEAEDLSEIDMSRYEFVIVTPAVLVPLVLPLLGTARCIFLALDYESFHHARGEGYDEFMAETPAVAALYALPVPIVTVSRPLVDLIRERIGRSAYYVPIGVDKSTFVEQPRRRAGARKRVLFVGNYLMPYKGMRDGLAGLERLAQEIDLELVLITQEERGRTLFSDCSFPIEIHFCPAEPQIPPIMASCDVYCCTSWYEGLGLPALEAFHCGLPVVSTRTIGVGEYGRDGVNLLLADPNAPEDLSERLRQVLLDARLSERLRREGLRTAARGFAWSQSVDCFLRAVHDIAATYTGAGPVDRSLMDRHLDALERQGSYTPIAIVRRFDELNGQLAVVCDDLRTGGAPQAHHVQALEAVRDTLAPYLENPETQYYRAFRAKYDLARLLLVLMASKETVGHIPLVLTRTNRRRSKSNGSALTERRYTVD